MRHGMCELMARYSRGTEWAQHGMCELTARHGMGTAWERHGRDMGTAWARHAMCESALRCLWTRAQQAGYCTGATECITDGQTVHSAVTNAAPGK